MDALVAQLDQYTLIYAPPSPPPQKLFFLYALQDLDEGHSSDPYCFRLARMMSYSDLV